MGTFLCCKVGGCWTQKGFDKATKVNLLLYKETKGDLGDEEMKQVLDQTFVLCINTIG